AGTGGTHPNDGTDGSIGGYAGAGVNGDSTTDESLKLGSGGGGGGGANLAGGAGGGAGGGYIKFISTGNITVSSGARILANGAGGGGGNTAEGGYGGGGGGGAGAGGGILLKATGTLTLSSTSMYALGANNSTTNGGTIKLLYGTLSGSAPSSSNAGRVYSATLNAAPSAPQTPYCNNITAQSGQANPTGLTDLTPAFSAVYDDDDESDTAEYYEIEVDTSSSFDGARMWDTGKVTLGGSLSENVRCSNIIYSGPDLLLDGMKYYWRIRFWDDGDATGTWSTVQNFSMSGLGVHAAATATTVIVQKGSGASSNDFKLVYNETDAGASAGYLGGVGGDWSTNYLAATELLTELDQDTDYKVDKSSFLEVLESSSTRTILSNEYALGAEATIVEDYTIYPKGKVYKDTDYQKDAAGTEARRVDDAATDFIATGMTGYFGSTPSTTRATGITYNDYQLMDVIGTTTAEVTDYQNPDVLDFLAGSAVSGDERWDEVKTSGGLWFDGDDDHVDLGTSFLSGTRGTVETWFKAQDLSAEDYIFDHYNSGNRLYLRHDSGGGVLRIGIGDNAPTVGVTIVTDRWYHLALAYDSGTYSFYVDGTLADSDTYTGSPITFDSEFCISVGSAAIHGYVDEFRYWSIARTQQQIQDNMYKELTGEENGLAGYWKLNDGSGTSANDLAGSNNGTLDNGPVWVQGYVGDGYNEAEGVYTVDCGGDYATGKPQAMFDLDGSSNQRYNPVFKFRHYTSFTDPDYYIENTQKTNGTDYIADLAPFTDAYLANYSSGAPLMTDISQAGDAASSSEYLTLTTRDQTLTLDEPARNALDFDMTNDYVNLGTMDVVAGGAGDDGITIEAWFKADSFSTDDERIISKASSTSEEGHYWMLGVTDTAGVYRLRFRLRTGTTTTTLIATSGDLQAGVWTHAAVTYDGTDMKIHKDGTQVGTVGKTGTIATSGSVSANIGRNPGTGGDATVWDGLIREVRIWDIGRTQQQIQDNMSVDLVGNETNLLAYWKLDEGTGQTITDSAGSNNGTLGADSGSASDDPVWYYGANDGTADADALYFASHQKFYGVNIDLDTMGGGGNGEWQYWDGDSWADISVSETAANAKKFYADGAVYWADTDVLGWQKTALGAGDETDLVGYWDFNEGSSGSADGATVHDRSGNGNNGTADNGANNIGLSWTGAGRAGNCIDFDGTDDYVSMGDNVDIESAITVEVWVKTDSVSGDHVIDKNNEYAFYFSGTTLRWKIGTTDPTNAVYSSWSDGKWYHLVGIWDGIDASLYIDGAFIGTDTRSATATTNALFIGADSPTPGSYFDGLIDEVRIYNTVRTPAQIKADYERGRAYYQTRFVTTTAYTTNPVENQIKTDLMVVQDLTNTFNTATSDTVQINYKNAVWYDSDWSYRKRLSFDNSDQTETLYDFPMLVKLTSNNFNFSNAKTNGEDIRFVDSDNYTELDYEIEYWDQGSSTAFIWVKVPAIDGSSSTDHIYMYYGYGDATDAQDVSGVWSNGYVGVWHLDEGDSPGTTDFYKDSTVNLNHGTLTDATGGSAAATKIDGAFDFEGDADYITVDGSTSLDSATGVGQERSVMLWIKTTTTDNEVVLEKGSNQHFIVQTNSSANAGKISFRTNAISTGNAYSTTLVNDGNWHFVAGVYDGTNNLIYVDDGDYEDSTAELAPAGDANDLVIGCRPPNVAPFDGTLDEIRVSNITRSADWIAAQYKSTADTFVAIGTEITSTDSEILARDTTLTVTYPGEFEIRFDENWGGAITHWYDLANDSDKSENLAIIENDDERLLFVQTFQGTDYGKSSKDDISDGHNGTGLRMLETSPTRTIVEAKSNISRTTAGTDPDTLFTIDYSIYPKGQIYPTITRETNTAEDMSIFRIRSAVDTSTSWTAYAENNADLNVDGESSTAPNSYAGFWANNSASDEHLADAFITMYKDWADEDALYYYSEPAYKSIYWQDNPPQWAVGSSEIWNVFMLLRPDTLNSQTSGVNYMNDYRNPDALDFSAGSAVSGDERWDEAETSGGLSFDGTDDYAKADDTAALSPTTAVTVEAWFFVDATPGDAGKSTSHFGMVQKDGGYSGYGNYGFRLMSDFRITAMLSHGSASGEGKTIYSNGGIIKNKWQHVAMTYDKNVPEYNIYINGTLDESDDTYSQTLLDSGDSFVIGIGDGRYFSGKIDEVRVWNVARTQTQIRENMYKELTGSESNLVAYYKLNDGSGQTVTDSAGSSDGQLGATTGSEASDPSWHIGYAGDGYNEAEGCYTVTCGGTYNTGTPQTAFDLDGSSNQRYNPVFKLRHYTSFTDPTYYIDAGAAKTNDTDYVADLIPFTDAHFMNDTAGDPTMTDLAQAGDVDCAREYFASTSKDYTLDLDEAAASPNNGTPDGDAIYFGSHQKFYGVNIDLDTNGVGGDGEWQYWDGDSWTDISVSETATDAKKFFADGAVYWADTDVLGWQKTAVGAGDETGLVGYWDFNEDTSGSADGDTIYDRSSNSNNGTGVDGANDAGLTWTAGRLGNAIDFDGVDDYVTTADITVESTDLTFSIWLKADTLASDQGALFTKNSDDIMFETFTDGSLHFSINSTQGSPEKLTAANTILTGNWYHVAAVYDYDNDDATIYVNGSPVANSQGDETLNKIPNSAPAIEIGARSGGPWDPFDGILDDARIYNIELTASQVKALYEAGRQYYQTRFVTTTAYTTNPVENQIKTDLMVIQDMTNTFDTATSDTVFINKTPNATPSAPNSLSPADGSGTTDTTPTLNFTQSDDDVGDTVKYRIQIDDSADFGSLVVDYTSALIAQGATSFTVGQAAGSGTYTVGTESQTLSDADYYWRVMSTDNSDADGSWATANGGSEGFVVDNVDPTGESISSITANSTSQLTVASATGADAGSGLNTSPYWFNETTGGAGATDSSAWQASTDFVDSGLSANTQYTYQVKLRDDATNETSYSSTSSKYTLIETPTTPTFGTITASSIVLNTSGVSNVATSTSGAYFDSTTGGGDGGINAWVQATTDTATGLSENTEYTFQVKARNGNSAETSYSSTDARYTVLDAPADGELTFSSINPTSIDVSVTSPPNSSSGTTGAEFDCITGAGSGGTDRAMTVNNYSYTDADLSVNTQYGYKVRYQNGDGTDTTWNTTEKLVYTACNVPSAPTVSATATNTLSVDVNVNGNPSATTFAIAVDDDGDGTSFNTTNYVQANGTISTSAVWQDDTTWGTKSVTGLSANKLYRFKVKAINGDTTETSLSSEATKYTLIETPATPTFGAITASSIVLNTSGVTNITAGSSGAYFDSTTAGGDGGINAWVQATTDTATGLSANVQYTFQVMARNGDGTETSNSSTAAKYSGAALPVSSAFTGVTATAIQANWTANGNPGGTEYYVEYDEGTSFVATEGNSGWITNIYWNKSSLSESTAYSFRVRARNAESAVTDWVSLSYDTTLSGPPSITGITRLFDNEKLADTTPAFTFTGTDPESVDLDYQIEWDTDVNFGSATTKSSSDYPTDAGWTAATFTSATATTYTVQAGNALSNGTTYWWQVRTRDPAGSNTWSSWSTARSFTIDTTVTVPTWFQTTKEQFDTGTVTGTTAPQDGTDDVRMDGP
ncbi:DUF2341 domain-containing protein, partial [Candidatus Omnitrophota bacterium]